MHIYIYIYIYIYICSISLVKTKPNYTDKIRKKKIKQKINEKKNFYDIYIYTTDVCMYIYNRCMYHINNRHHTKIGHITNMIQQNLGD